MKKNRSTVVTKVLNLPRSVKQFVALGLDCCLCWLTLWIAYYLRLGEFISFTGPGEWVQGAVLAGVISVSIALPLFIFLDLYRAIFRYSGWPALSSVAQAVGIYGLLYSSIFMVIGVDGIPRTIGLIQPILMLLFVGASRVVVRVWLGDSYLNILRFASRPKALVYGAGRAGRELVAALANSQELQVVGFLDDDVRLHGHLLNGKPVFNPADLVGLARRLSIRHILLAMPSVSRRRRKEILAEISSARVAVRTLPRVSDLAQGRISVSNLKELDVDDLLGRDLAIENHSSLAPNISGKLIMVTGAGGSIGSELCRQILSAGPKKILLVEQSESALYNIHQELQKNLADRDSILVPLLASVQDDRRMREIMSTWRPNAVYHAAAYKHVPLVEHNPAEGIKNNLFGTLRTALAAADNGVTDFVLISTDKAVRPSNVMGASKRLAEMVLQGLNGSKLGTRFSMVRFGNVLGSSGSVVPKFRQQICDGGPITLTHPEITRYFMTIAEASQLVIQAGAMARGGEVFVLDMGQPIKILDLARQMVALSGLTVQDEQNPDGDIRIEITGLRPGEKLYEELLIGDNPGRTAHSLILKAQEEFIPWPELEPKLTALELALSVDDFFAVRSIMEQLVAGYALSNRILDLVCLEREAKANQLRLNG